MTLRLPGHLPAAIDAVLEEREARADFIRAAIERELGRRRRAAT
jgi:metal-responsive CopG/Arc/MetJ family transcriptional regulator